MNEVVRNELRMTSHPSRDVPHAVVLVVERSRQAVEDGNRIGLAGHAGEPSSVVATNPLPAITRPSAVKRVIPTTVT